MNYSRISSGFEFIDAAYGGLYSNRTYLLRGPAQSGRTSFALQFLLSGFRSGESGILITNERLDTLLVKSEALGFPLENALMENKLILLEYPFEILSGNFQLGGVVHFLSEIEQYIKSQGCTRLVFDTFVPLLARVNEAQLSNYVYSLTETLEQLYVTTMLITGQPNSPSAARIVELLEDAAMGSFSLDFPSKTNQEYRTLSIQKMINPFFPPVVYNIHIEYGRGLTLNPNLPMQLNESKHNLAPQLVDLPIVAAVLDRESVARNQFFEIFNRESHLEHFKTLKELTTKANQFDFDLVLINADTMENWVDAIRIVRETKPKQAIFILAPDFTPTLNYQSVKQAGGDGLFVNPIIRDDIAKAFEKTLVRYDTLDEVLTKRLPAITTQQTTNALDIEDASSGVDNTIVTYPVFKEIMNLQIVRDYPTRKSFSLVSFRIVNTATAETGSSARDDSVQAFQQIAKTIRVSLRNTDDRLCRHMNKMLVLLTDCKREGSEIFVKRIVAELKSGSLGQRMTVGKQLMLFTSISVFPDDAVSEQDMLAQVSDNNRNMMML